MIIAGVANIANDDLADKIADKNSNILTTSFVDQTVNTSAGNITVPPAVTDDGSQFICFNATSGAVYTTEMALQDNQAPSGSGILYATDDAVGKVENVNCSVNSSDFSQLGYQSVNDSMIAVTDLTDWTDTLVVIAAIAIILGLVIGGFAMRKNAKTV